MTTDKAARKERPIARGVLGYFPDAIAEVAHVSFIGNQQHNPGEPMHWARGKSDDHADCAARHLIEAGTIDTDGLRHTAKLAWRALAMLQLEVEAAELEESEMIALSGGTGITAVARVNPVEFFCPNDGNFRRFEDYHILTVLGCPPPVARQIVDGTTYTDKSDPSCYTPYVYIAGPMRGYEKFNFPAFDAARDRFIEQGFNVISPADIDRASHPDADQVEKVDVTDQTVFAFRDFWAIYFLARQNNPENGIVLLPGWEKSVGAAGEFFLTRWLKLKCYRCTAGESTAEAFLHNFALAHSVKGV